MKKVIDELRLKLNNEKVIVTCSCGVDSIVLLHLTMKALQSSNIIVAHVNHNKREESITEQKYIEDFCNKNHLKLEVLVLPKKYDGNFQEWARNKRYEFFENVAKENNAKYILLAHHANDNIETILMRILKTSSLKGYAGMEKCVEQNGLYIYRPLLNTPKSKIEEFAKINNIKYFEDSSNETDDYTRNRIRHHIVPLLLEENPSLYSSFEKYSQTILSANKLLEKVKLEFIENKVSVNNNDIKFNISDLLELDEDIRIHVLFRVLKKYNLSRVCIDEIYKQIISNKNNIVTSFSNSLSMIKEYGYVLFTDKSVSIDEVDIKIENEGSFIINDCLSIIVDKNICYFKAPKTTLWYNIESLPIVVRNRRNGDKIKLKSGTKSVSDFLTNKKVPYMQRKDTLVLCDEFNNVLHILGYVTK